MGIGMHPFYSISSFFLFLLELFQCMQVSCHKFKMCDISP
ncbi:hypothetical protein GLYMA_04G068951v4 [Glycine max]|nr:hypothetical protein GLYMA_04G068951v4 [Glycine max]KAH1110181.1 hypothetical protein GYH30_009180 [Glycine max]